jgi:hypothetical protein
MKEEERRTKAGKNIKAGPCLSGVPSRLKTTTKPKRNSSRSGLTIAAA